jgi:benzoate/toluate 1,2-dioxygenase alpha subunit/2,4,5-trichlorophenoxyacetic acid oxygenase 1
MDISALIDDRPQEGVFRVHRDAFTDPAIFDLEMKHIFEATWAFVGMESQVPNDHDFFTTTIGRQPVIISRGADGKLTCVLNSCRHRGMLVCPQRSGNQQYHVCKYHGWSYNSAGKSVGIPHQREGLYPEGFASEDHNLVPVARFENYRGFLFASLCKDVPPLKEHLGEACTFIDLVAEQSPSGLEVLSGAITYTFNANWKLQFENGLDFYHFSSTHASYVDVARKRPVEGEARWVDDSSLDQGTFSFERGHAVMWSNRNSLRVLRPLQQEAETLEELRSRVGEVHAKWMQLNRNLTIFPNMQLIDVTSLQLRLWRPLAADKTEMISYCLAPVGESVQARRRRIRQYEDFFNPSGLATSDDNMMYEFSQAGLNAGAAGWTQGYLRGLGQPANPPSLQAVELGILPSESIAGGFTMGAETCLHTGYREWSRLLRQGLARVPAAYKITLNQSSPAEHR